METKSKGLVADVTVNEGESAVFRQGRSGDLISNMFGKYAELARRGRLFQGVTPVAGVAPGTSIGTSGAIALANPFGSNVDLYVQLAIMTYKSGTLGVGHADWVAHLDNLILPTGTAITPVAGRLGGASPQGRLLTAATVLTGGSVFRPLCSFPAFLATTLTMNNLIMARDEVDGAIVIPPAHSVSLQATAASGSTPLVRYLIMWAEGPR